MTSQTLNHTPQNFHQHYRINLSCLNSKMDADGSQPGPMIQTKNFLTRSRVQVSLKMDADGSELEPVKSTGGSKTDSLIPGSSYSNANRFCPLPASLLLLKRAPHMSLVGRYTPMYTHVP